MDLTLPQPLEGVVDLVKAGQLVEARTALGEAVRTHPGQAAAWLMVARLLMSDESAILRTLDRELGRAENGETRRLWQALESMPHQDERREMDTMMARLERFASRLERMALPMAAPEPAAPPPHPVVAEPPPVVAEPPPEEVAEPPRETMPPLAEADDPAQQAIANLQRFLDRLVSPVPEAPANPAAVTIGHLETFLERIQQHATRTAAELAVARLQKFLQQIEAMATLPS